MVTGGVQHFLDNPAYSAALIPAGLVLALLAFLAREGVPLSTRLPRVVGGTVAAAALLFAGLTTAARARATAALALRKGHSPVDIAALEADLVRMGQGALYG